MGVQPSRGQVWLADLNPTRGHEQAGTRPVLVVSHNTFNHGPAGLVFVLPLTRTDRRIPAHIPINPPEGGVKVRSYVLWCHPRDLERSAGRSCLGRSII